MEFSVGLVGRDFVLTASDQNHCQSIVRMKNDLVCDSFLFNQDIAGEDILMILKCIQTHLKAKPSKDLDKHYKLGTRFLMTVNGESGDTNNFAEYIQKNIQLYKMRNGYELTPHSGANYVRKTLADYLRSRTPYNVNLLLSGFDEIEGASLYRMDYLGAMVKAPFVAHGYGSFFSLSILDRHWKPDLSLEEATALLQTVIKQVQKRFIVSFPAISMRVVDKDGIQDIGTYIPPVMAS